MAQAVFSLMWPLLVLKIFDKSSLAANRWATDTLDLVASTTRRGWYTFESLSTCVCIELQSQSDLKFNPCHIFIQSFSLISVNFLFYVIREVKRVPWLFLTSQKTAPSHPDVLATSFFWLHTHSQVLDLLLQFSPGGKKRHTLPIKMCNLTLFKFKMLSLVLSED